VTDSGFIDEAPPGHRRTGDGPRARRRPGAPGVVLTVAVLALLAFAGWAWSGRVHADDLDAYAVLAEEIEVMDRTLPPLAHSEAEPCADATGSSDGVITRSYPPSNGPAASEVVDYLTKQGWAGSTPTPPAVARLSRVAGGRTLMVDVEAPSLDDRVTALTARSPGSAGGCVLR
jgi:hypothetical protein